MQPTIRLERGALQVPKRAAPLLSSSTSNSTVYPHIKKVGKKTWMDEWSGLTAPEPGNQQPTGVAASKLDDSSLKSAPESTQVPFIDENNEEVGSRICGKVFLIIGFFKKICPWCCCG